MRRSCTPHTCTATACANSPAPPVMTYTKSSSHCQSSKTTPQRSSILENDATTLIRAQQRCSTTALRLGRVANATRVYRVSTACPPRAHRVSR